MIIFGTRSYFRTKSVIQHGFCENCNQFAKLRSFTAMNFFHLYFVPVIPLSGRKRHHKTCGKCNTAMQMAPDALESLITALKERAADAVVAIQNGETMFEPDASDDSEPTEVVEFLRGAFDWLYASGEKEFCSGIVAMLSGPSAAYAKSMLSASMDTMANKIDDAINHYEDAVVADSNKFEPHANRAHLLVVRRRRDEAIAAYQTAIEKVDDKSQKAGLYLQLAPEHMGVKNFDAAVDCYEAAIAILPEAANDKSISRGLKKAKKKSGRA